MKKLIFPLFITGCFISEATFAADTLTETKPIFLEKIGREYAPGYLLIDKKFFRVPYVQNIGFFNSLSYPHNKFTQVYFRHCNFNVFESSARMPLSTLNSGFYVIDSCTVNLLPIFNTTGDIRITSSVLNNLSVDHTNGLNLSLSNNSSISFIGMQNNRNMKFQLMHCAFKDSGEIRIFNTTISEFAFLYDKRSGCNVLFQNSACGRCCHRPLVATNSHSQMLCVMGNESPIINVQFIIPGRGIFIILRHCT